MTDKEQRLEQAQREARDALGTVDVRRLVRLIEQDARDDIMSPGQRKSAHLLLSYYAPKAAPEHAKPDDGLHLTSAQILAMLQEIRALKSGGPGGSNSGPVPASSVDTDPPARIVSQPTGSANRPPSPSEADSSAGGLMKGEVLTDTPRTNAVSNSPDADEKRSREVPDSVKRGLL